MLILASSIGPDFMEFHPCPQAKDVQEIVSQKLNNIRPGRGMPIPIDSFLPHRGYQKSHLEHELVIWARQLLGLGFKLVQSLTIVEIKGPGCVHDIWLTISSTQLTALGA